MPLIRIFNSFFGRISPHKHTQLSPSFDPQIHLSGPIKAWGTIHDESGNITSRFSADLIGSWKNNKGTLNETFFYKGTDTIDKRSWTIHKLNDTQYEGFADDIIGKAKGQAFGNAMRWFYKMNVEVKDKKFLMHCEDWMWLIDDETIMNKIAIRKFGIQFAEVSLIMKRNHD